MPDSHRFDREPAEGSREIVEHELKESGSTPASGTSAERPVDDDVFDKARDDIEGHRDEPSSLSQEAARRPASGPHARPELTNEDATPGAGTLPNPDETEVEATSS